MSEMLQQPFASTAFESKKPPQHASFWLGLPAEGFTAECSKHLFRDDTERQRRKLAGVKAEQELADN